MFLTFLRAILIAAVATTGVIVITVAFYGDGQDGFAVAARNTARFSGLLFSISLLARAWPLRVLHEHRWPLTYAFVSSHMVHFASVVALASADPNHPLHEFQLSALGAAGPGFIHISLIALTANAPARWKSLLHNFLYYVAGVFFAVAFGARFRAHTASAVMLIVLLSALVTRIVIPLYARADMKKASAGS